jgi:hypothetical protein
MVAELSRHLLAWAPHGREPAKSRWGKLAPSFPTAPISLFAALAPILTGVGLCGVAYAVSQRTQQLIPAAYLEACGKPSPYEKHAPMSLMWEVNADGHAAGAPRDAFFNPAAAASELS